MKSIYNEESWKQSPADVFWGEIAPCDHVVQIYENDGVFIDMLSAFVQGGIRSGDGVIIIATKEHREALQLELLQKKTDITTYTGKQYFPVDAEEMLSRFMVKGWPDEKLFMEVIADLLKQVRVRNRKVRAFGEMVAMLWAQGNNGATVQLEHLWNKFCEKEVFCLYCAYPKSGFTTDIQTSLEHICSAHSKMITPSSLPNSDLLYRRMNHQKAV